MTMALSDEIRALFHEEEEEEYVYKNYVRGPFVIKHVPYVKFSEGIGPDGSEAYIPGNVMYNLGKTIAEMNASSIYETDYRDYI